MLWNYCREKCQRLHRLLCWDSSKDLKSYIVVWEDREMHVQSDVCMYVCSQLKTNLKDFNGKQG